MSESSGFVCGAFLAVRLPLRSPVGTGSILSGTVEYDAFHAIYELKRVQILSPVV